MAEFREVIKQFNRMCDFYQSKRSCPMGCPMNGLNVSQCRKQITEAYIDAERIIMGWTAEHPEPVYPTWYEWLANMGVVPIKLPPNQAATVTIGLLQKIPAEIAQKLGIEPKEVKRE